MYGVPAMNLNVYIEDQLARQLNEVVESTGKSRNAVIREAVKSWIEHYDRTSWPLSVREFEGIEDFPAFEDSREDLEPPKEDPFE